MKLKLDLHVHTEKSADAHTRLEDIVPSIRRAGLDGIAITDHNTLSAPVIEEALLIPGIEVSSREGHIIGLGVRNPIPRGLSAEDTIRGIKQEGGVSIVAHPYDLYRSAINPEKLTMLPDALEVINSASIFHSITWKKARAFAKSRNLSQTAGSDSHIPETIGKAFTTIDCEERTPESVLDAIRKGSTVPEGRPNNLSDRLRKLAR
ncbi:PHP domain-containing protein [Candidatus Bathyarchaeota archaeon]|nr:PHP domain-containing protein [Candidatus Bathyarchaeota archaeon]